MTSLPLAIFFFIAAYAIGSFNAGFYLVRWIHGEDIRLQFSGSTGARNAGRRLGKAGFLAVFALDAAKGVVIILLAHSAGIAQNLLPWVAPLVVAGHIWPPQLKFKGGKGVATSIGSLCALLAFTKTAVSISQVTAIMITFGLVLLAHRSHLKHGRFKWRSP